MYLASCRVFTLPPSGAVLHVWSITINLSCSVHLWHERALREKTNKKTPQNREKGKNSRKLENLVQHIFISPHLSTHSSLIPVLFNILPNPGTTEAACQVLHLRSCHSKSTALDVHHQAPSSTSPNTQKQEVKSQREGLSKSNQTAQYHSKWHSSHNTSEQRDKVTRERRIKHVLLCFPCYMVLQVRDAIIYFRSQIITILSLGAAVTG